MKFDEWFNGQFGPEPSPKATVYELQAEVSVMRTRLLRCEKLLEQKREYERKCDAALKAWVAREDYLKSEAE